MYHGNREMQEYHYELGRFVFYFHKIEEVINRIAKKSLSININQQLDDIMRSVRYALPELSDFISDCLKIYAERKNILHNSWAINKSKPGYILQKIPKTDIQWQYENVKDLKKFNGKIFNLLQKFNYPPVKKILESFLNNHDETLAAYQEYLVKVGKFVIEFSSLTALINPSCTKFKAKEVINYLANHPEKDKIYALFEPINAFRDKLVHHFNFSEHIDIELRKINDLMNMYCGIENHEFCWVQDWDHERVGDAFQVRDKIIFNTYVIVNDQYYPSGDISIVSQIEKEKLGREIKKTLSHCNFSNKPTNPELLIRNHMESLKRESGCKTLEEFISAAKLVGLKKKQNGQIDFIPTSYPPTGTYNLKILHDKKITKSYHNSTNEILGESLIEAFSRITPCKIYI